MSDERLRELERRWKETASPSDEAAYLSERVRVGDLAVSNLELAANLGHRGAGLALGVAECERRAHERQTKARIKAGISLEPETQTWLKDREEAIGVAALAAEVAHADWLQVLSSFGQEVSVRVALVAAEAIRNTWSPDHGDEEWRIEANRAFESVVAWVFCPCPDHCEEIEFSLEPANRLVNWSNRAPEPRLFFAGPCYSAAEAAHQGERGEHQFAAYDAADTAARVIAYGRGRDRHGDVGPENIEIREDISRLLAPWALGYGDPLRERVEDRRRESYR